MKGREGKGPPSTDLLVCFPSRAHLTLMPKPICSPARTSEANKRHHNHHHHHHSHHHHRLKKSINRGGSGGQASPLLWAKTKPMNSEIAEPTSPKVTCAGQIKVRHKPNSCKNWQSVMEEIERLHNKKQKNKRHTWVEALGFKKEIMQFLTCLRSIRLDFRCFGSFPTPDITSDDEDEDEDEDEHLQENHLGREASDHHDAEASRTVFSKWFMVLQENQYKDMRDASYSSVNSNEKDADDHHAPCAPPSNALLLMRCRSAPAKRCLEDENEDKADENEDVEEEKRSQLAMEEEKKKRNDQSLVVMRYNTDFAKLSTDIAKETWVVDGIKDPLSRSRSWKR